MSDDIEIRNDLRVGDLGRIIALHGEGYSALPSFGLLFEAFVARTVAEYVLDDGANGRIWMAERGGELLGCAAMILRAGNLGQLRWILVTPAARGIGLGKDLVNRALDYARENGCSGIFLETTDGLPESQQLYETLGFKVTSDTQEELWDDVRPLIRMELALT